MSKMTLTKKLLIFILPLLVVPILSVLFFFYLYVNHLIEKETVEIAKNFVFENCSHIEKDYHSEMVLQDYLLYDKSLSKLTIIDANLTILADNISSKINTRFVDHSAMLTLYLQETLESNSDKLAHLPVGSLVIKPFKDPQKRIVGFVLSDYKMLLQQKQTIVSQTFVFILFMVMLILSITIIMTVMFAYNIVNPIKQLIDGIEKISNGNLSTQLSIKANDEIGILGKTFNDMVAKLRLSNVVFKNTQEAIIVTDNYTKIMDVNKAFCDITGYSKADVLGKPTSLLKSGRHDSDFYDQMWNSIIHDGSWQGNIWNKKKNGVLYPEWLNITAIKDEVGKIKNFIAVFSDITQLKENEKRLEFLAHHDTLTALPNRLLLSARMEHSINICKRLNSYAGICYLDLDNFKNINDNYGHDIGDEVLKEAARRLESMLRSDDTLARIGGDEFVLVFENLQKPNEMSAIADKILHTLKEPFLIANKKFHLGGSIGISIYPDDGLSTVALSKNADTAMYAAKSEGKHTYRFYNEAMTIQANEKFALENALKKALSSQEMVVFYQPKYDLASHSIQDLEALVRWRHPKEGILAPDRFIPLAEESGLIIPIGEFVLRQACNDALKWHNEGIFNGRIAVNVSGVQINKSDFVATLKSILQETGARSEMIEIEVTESVMMNDPEKWICILTEVKALGVHISIDDFGTGYASLNHLRRLPVNTLKIDRSFVKDLAHDVNADTITSAIISLAQSMGMQTVAEGVETEEQKSFLQSCGCGLHQGYLYAKAVDQEHTHTLLKERKSLD